MNRSVLIVGSGLAGLTAALRLSRRGFNVELLEKNSMAGGRLNQLTTEGYIFDTGPSFFSMSYEFDEFINDAGIKMPFEFVELDPLYTVNFLSTEKTYTMYKDLARLAGEFKEVEPDMEDKIKRYLNAGKMLFDGTVDLVVRKNYNSLLHYFFTLMKAPPKLMPVLFRNFWQQVSKYFTSEEVRQILSLVAFFVGRTPFDTPAVYSLLSYTEFIHNGYFNVKGGMYKITEGLCNELQKQNIKIHYNTEVVDFEDSGNRLKSLADQNGKKWESDIFLINSDAAWFRGKIFKRPAFSAEKLNRLKWTMGTLTFYLGITEKIPEIQHHNYYLGSNFKEYANKIFTNPSSFEKPYYYVNVLSKSNPDCAPEGCESLFFVCPVPDLRFKPDWSDSDKIVDSIIKDFSERTGVNIQNKIAVKTVYTPVDWGEQYHLYKGSALGLAHDMNQIGGFRPKNYDEKFNNVFYAGASTVPGTGLPMAVISSKLAVERIEKYDRTV
ncbi:MAG: phytoene desaturase family protein [Prolixibacteraceae bacterium]|nr:phytoene desaturase family protein [Prolixibacteraceae bacterium]